MTTSRLWTRRDFGRAAGAVAAMAAMARSSLATSPNRAARFAFVGSKPQNGQQAGTIHVFRVTNSDWAPVMTVPAAAPAHLLAHPSLPVLYAVHNVGEWQHLPRGAVSTYHLDRQSGQLTHLHTQPLSLSATHPRHAVLTRDASHLFVPAEGGGIYNLLPVAADGTLLPPSAIRKEFGLEGGAAKTAAPNTVALLPDGSLLAADSGLETLSNFSFDNGVLTLRHRSRVHRGEGPTGLTLSPCGNFAYTAGALSEIGRRHRLEGGRVTEESDFARQTLFPQASRAAHVRDASSLLVV